MQSQKYFSIIPKQERIQDLAQGGGDKSKNFLSPPLSSWIAQAGDNSQGGGQSPPEIAQGGTVP